MELLYKDKTEHLIRGFFLVQNEVGLGRNEEAYQQAYKIWVRDEQLNVLSKPKTSLFTGNHEAHILYPDFLAWNSICIELKALPRVLGTSEELQLFDYLRAIGCRLGLLVNMGLDRVHVERRIYDPLPTTMIEDWGHWSGAIEDSDRRIEESKCFLLAYQH